MGEKTISITRKRAATKPSLGIIARRYVPRQVLGRGGMGEVLLAYDRQLERLVAVKRIHLRVGEAPRRSALALAEARRLAGLQHPNIVTVYDILNHRGDVVMVMEYLDGVTFEDLEQPLTVREFVEFARDCLDALSAAHSLGVVHLDLKPTNIMLANLASGRRQVKLLDFGLAGMAGPPAAGAQGTVLASVYTVAPEQLEAGAVDARTDLYSLGCVFYHALARREPFQGVSVQGVIEAHFRHSFRPLIERRPDLPLSLCAWVETLMARYPEDRPASAASAMGTLFAMAPLWEEFRPSGSPVRGVLDLQAADRERLEQAIGLPARVRGTVERVWANAEGSIRFLNFSNVPHADFAVVVPRKSASPGLDPAELDALIGREVTVTGVLSEFHGGPQIVVASGEQISPSAA